MSIVVKNDENHDDIMADLVGAVLETIGIR